jgi:hypothetical protein
MFPSPYRVDALLIGPAEGDIGVDCLLFCNHYKDHGWGYVQYHDLE